MEFNELKEILLDDVCDIMIFKYKENIEVKWGDKYEQNVGISYTKSNDQFVLHYYINHNSNVYILDAELSDILNKSKVIGIKNMYENAEPITVCLKDSFNIREVIHEIKNNLENKC